MSPLLFAAAMAQNFDASGQNLPPDTPSARDPISTFGGRPMGAGAITILGEGGSALLVREVTDGPYARIEPVLDSVFGANLGASVGFAKRFGVAASIPLWFGTTAETPGGPALGDLQVWLPVSVAFQPKRYGISVIPFVRLPTGPGARYLGDPFGGGAIVSTSFHAGMLSTGLDLGLEGRGDTGDPLWPGGLTGQVAAAVGVAPSESFGAHLEIRSRAPLFRDLVSIPSEALISLKGRPVERIWLTMGAGAAVTRGVGAATPRIVFGTTISLAKKGVDPEIAVQPGPVAVKELYVVDQRRFPIQGVQVTVGNDVVETDPEGFADIPVKAFEKAGAVKLEHPAYVTIDRSDLDPTSDWWEIVMDRKPVTVEVSVVGPDGEPMLDGKVVMKNVEDPAAPEYVPTRIDELGVHHWELAPGSKWVATMTADRMGGQARVIDIRPERVEPIRVDVVLAWAVDPTTKLTVNVVDGAGDPVEDAAVAVENRDFGTTGPGGSLEIGGLPRGEHAITVRSPLYGEASVADVTVGDDAKVTVTLDWPAGAVVARVKDGNGRPLDATVSFQGPASIPPRQVGSDGEKLFVLRPGPWTLHFEHEGLAAQERSVVVDDQAGVSRELLVVLVPEPPGKAEVVVRVADAEGAPIPGVELALDGVAVGTTGEDGSITLLDLEVGDRKLTANGELLFPTETPVELVDGRQVVDVPMEWVSGVVDVRAEANGEPVAMTITPKGDHAMPPIQIGPSGEERVVLTPGTWELEATTEDGEVRTQTVVVQEKKAPQEVVFQVLDGNSDITVQVADAHGNPIPDAQVKVGDVKVGHTESSGSLAVAGLDPGKSELTVVADGFEANVSQVVVKDDMNVMVVLEAPPQPVQLTVVGPAGPVKAEIQLRSTDEPTRTTNVDGTGVVRLDEGEYRGIVKAPGLAPQEVEITVGRGSDPVIVDVDLKPAGPAQPLVFAVEDTTGAPVANAPVYVGETEVGRTSDVGTVTLTDVPKTATIRVEPVAAGVAPLEVPAARASGSTFVAPDAPRDVPVTASFEDGEVVGGATVRVADLGIDVKTDKSGAATLELPPGTWTVTTEKDGQVAATTVVVPRAGEAPKVELALQKVEAKVTAGRVELGQPVLFDLDRAALRADSRALLEDVARRLKSDRSIALLEIAGHTDDQGGVVYNQQLSERRATIVRDALVGLGVEPERLVRRGYGLSRPASAGTDDASRQLNRRVEFVVLETAR
ncbi:MAG: OmpA family protein [Alphaproteobacteria bacterium]|nr:OmpA family protein [Alphaproteobacteria bacterium]